MTRGERFVRDLLVTVGVCAVWCGFVAMTTSAVLVTLALWGQR